MVFWWLGGWTLRRAGASLLSHENERGAIPRFLIDRTWDFSACIKDASPQLRLTLFSTPWAGGRVIGKNGLAQDAERNSHRTGDPTNESNN